MMLCPLLWEMTISQSIKDKYRCPIGRSKAITEKLGLPTAPVPQRSHRMANNPHPS